MKTLLLTGRMGSGKSSFINELFMLLNVPLTGLRSIRHFEDGKFTGFDMTIVEDYAIKDSWELARFRGNETRINADFKKATEFLNNLHRKEPVFIDELGRFERNDNEYLRAVEKLINSDTKSIISLKKEDLPFNNHLIEMSSYNKNIKFIDLDIISKEKLDEFIMNISGIKKEKIKKTVLYCEEYEKNIKQSIYNKKIHFYKIENIFNITAEFLNKERKNSEIFYYFTKNIDEMKRASDIGFVVLDDLNKI